MLGFLCTLIAAWLGPYVAAPIGLGCATVLGFLRPPRVASVFVAFILPPLVVAIIRSSVSSTAALAAVVITGTCFTLAMATAAALGVMASNPVKTPRRVICYAAGLVAVLGVPIAAGMVDGRSERSAIAYGGRLNVFVANYVTVGRGRDLSPVDVALGLRDIAGDAEAEVGGTVFVSVAPAGFVLTAEPENVWQIFAPRCITVAIAADDGRATTHIERTTKCHP